MKTLVSVKLWTLVIALIAFVSSVREISVLGGRPLVILLVIAKFVVVGLFMRHIRVARRAMRNGTTPVVKKMFCKSVKLTALIIILALVGAFVLGPIVGRKMHK